MNASSKSKDGVHFAIEKYKDHLSIKMISCKLYHLNLLSVLKTVSKHDKQKEVSIPRN